MTYYLNTAACFAAANGSMFMQSLCWWLQHNQVLVLRLSLRMSTWNCTQFTPRFHIRFLWYKLPSRIQPYHLGIWGPCVASSNLPADIPAWIQKPFHSHAPLKQLLAFSDLKKTQVTDHTKHHPHNKITHHLPSLPPSSLFPLQSAVLLRWESKHHFSANTPFFCSCIFWISIAMCMFPGSRCFI